MLASLNQADDKRRRKVVLLFAATALASATLYWLAFVQAANLLHLDRGLPQDLFLLGNGAAELNWRFLLAFAGLGFLYFFGYHLARRLQGRTAWLIVFGGALASSLALIFLFPLDAADIFDNILHGRILGIYGQNPFTQVINQFPKDPFFAYTAWKRSPAAYGPVWEILSGAAARLAGDGLLTNLIAFKLLPGSFFLASTFILGMILKRIDPKQAPARTLLFAWNPPVLYETWGNGHNDPLIVFWCLCAALALLHQRYTISILALVAGTLSKFIPILLIPAAIGLALSSLNGLRQRARFLVTSIVFSSLLIILAYLPFWAGVQVLSIERRRHLFSSTLPAVIYQLIRPRLGLEQAATTVSLAALILTILFALWQGYRAWRAGSWQGFIKASSTVLTFYLLLTCLWFQQWYPIWLIGLAPLLKPGPARRLALIFGFSALSKQLIFGPLLYVPRPTIQQPWLEIWFTLGVIAPIWLYLLYEYVQTRIRMRLQTRKLFHGLLASVFRF